MSALQDRRILAAVGGAALLLLAILLAAFFMRGHHKPPATPADAQAVAAGLQIEQGQADSRTASTKPLRCFVNGQFVGMATVSDCAAKNGVSAQALDVGLDPATGQVTAPSGTLAPTVQAVPAAPAEPSDDDQKPSAQAAPATAGPAGECLRYTPDGWRSAGNSIPLGQCARTLFDGRCERAGEAVYGRWGSQTLRLVPGRVEISPDNRNFRPLVSQNPQDCSLPPN
jgi:hypothetical protein